MPRISLPPFLKKLQNVTNAVDPEIAHWNEAGDVFIVEKSDEFEKVLGEYFKGSLLTFIRQLHFYGFRKVDIKGEKWSFSHKCFRKELPHLIFEIRRKTRTETNDGVASQLEVQALRDHVGKLHEAIKKLTAELKETKEELGILRHSVKRDSMRAFPGDLDPYGLESISNGGDVVSKKQKTSSSADAKKLDDMKLEPFTENEMEDMDQYMDNFPAFLPFTDSAYESMSLNAS